jgi:glutamate--cysteine ligase
MALPALWAGLLYDKTALDNAAGLIADWTEAERQAMRDAVPKLGLATPFRGRTLRDVAREVLALAEGGLLRRARLNDKGQDETHALKALIETVEEGQTPADRLLAAYEGPWQGNIDRLFDTQAL